MYALIFGLLAGCHKHEVGPGKNDSMLEGVDDNSTVYMSVKVQLPVVPGTRSQSQDDGNSDGGNEEGQDYENNVNQIYVILAEKTESGEYLYVSKSLSNSILSQSSSKPTYTVQFNSEELSKYVDKNSDVAGIKTMRANLPTYSHTATPLPL